jgi:hypothetical protein
LHHQPQKLLPNFAGSTKWTSLDDALAIKPSGITSQQVGRLARHGFATDDGSMLLSMTQMQVSSVTNFEVVPTS